ncbi:MAG: class II aldolase/adducin family protein [Thermoplasmata archaeon]|nr:class II aldolase/adducin family protein [Thermoplasmata archaeon]
MDRLILNGIGSICDTARELEARGWAKGFFGNISINLGTLDMEKTEVSGLYHHDLPVEDLIGSILLITRSGSTMSEVSKDPESHVGAYSISKRSMDLFWGEGPPTSEIGSHLLIHEIGAARGIIHCHLDNMERIEKDGVQKQGFGWVGTLEPGSPELAEATSEAARLYDTIIWNGHGVVCFAGDLQKALHLVFEADDRLSSRDKSVLVPRE